jgi:hypothetical protein
MELSFQISGECQIAGHHQGKFIGVRSQVALEIHSLAESRWVCGRRLHRRLLVICPPRGARSRDSQYRQRLGVPSTSLQTVPGALPYPPRSPLRGFGRARKRGYLSDLHDVLPVCLAPVRTTTGRVLAERRRRGSTARGIHICKIYDAIEYFAPAIFRYHWAPIRGTSGAPGPMSLDHIRVSP